MSIADRLRSAPRRRILLALIALALVLLLALAYWVFTAGPGVRLLSPPRATVTEFSGNADQTTTPFAVRSGWRIHWQSAGPRFALAVRGDQGLGTVISISEPASGVTLPAVGGTFYLEISAEGDWSIRIEQGD